MTALAFYLGGVVALLPLALGFRSGRPVADGLFILLFTLGWPALFVMWCLAASTFPTKVGRGPHR